MREAPEQTLALSPSVIAYGSNAPLAERVALRAGPLSLLFVAGDLREIRWGGQEVVRRVYVAVRDRNWETIPAELSDLRIERQDDSFAITYLAEHRRGPIDLAWRATIRGEASGTVTFAMDGEACATFWRNRIGLCVHHPIVECAGRTCRVEHHDGSIEDAVFPRLVSPHQPMRDIRALTHELPAGGRVEIRFAGEVFEMEDQRNWTDASFKTYGTPLDLPFPVEVARGTRIAQSVTIRLETPGTAVPVAPTGEPCEAAVEVGAGPGVPLPEIGLGMASHGKPLSPAEGSLLRALHLGHLRLDLDLTRPDFVEVLQVAGSNAAGLGVPLEIALFLGEDARARLEALRGVLHEAGPRIRTWWIYDASRKLTPEAAVGLARDCLVSYDPGAEFGGGTDGYFAELNRNRPPTSALDVVGYSINPQVHAFDLGSLAENLGGQADTVRSALAFAGGLPVAVGPITLRPRFNPHATGPEPEAGPGELPRHVDPRQISLFCAGWLVGCVRELALAGTSRLTFFETTGWRGVMETEAGSPLPEAFPSFPGAVFPLYHVLADVGEFAGGSVLPVRLDPRSRVEALALARGDGLRVLVANLGPTPRRVRVAGLRSRAEVTQLVESNAIEAMSRPRQFRAGRGESVVTVGGGLERDLPAFSLVRIDAD